MRIAAPDADKPHAASPARERASCLGSWVELMDVKMGIGDNSYK